MRRVVILLLGILATWIMAYFVLTVLPSMEFLEIRPSPGLTDYDESAARGRRTYITSGCIYCHSQQVRYKGFGADFERGWGRASEPSDYVFDAPHQLGTMRTGPDLSNIAQRQPSRDWHLSHFYNPRSVSPGSVMPNFRWMFAEKAAADSGDVVVPISGPLAPAGKVVTARREAVELFEYLMTLHHGEFPK